MFVNADQFHPNLTIAGKDGAYPNGAPTGLHSKDRLLRALSANIRLGWKYRTITNALAHYDI